MLIVLLFSKIIVLLTCTERIKGDLSSEQNAETIGNSIRRLPNTTRPLSYDLSLKTFLHKSKTNFDGTVLIQIQVLENTSEIVVHSKDLEILSVSLIKDSNISAVLNVSYTFDTSSEFLQVKLEEPTLQLTKDEIWFLNVSYSGKLRDNDSGFFKKPYSSFINKNMYMVATQFEASFARCALPCYDEPALKATFKISITHDRLLIAVSNMPDDGELIDNQDGTRTTNFRPTPPMSTYLIAFAIGNFKITTTNSLDITYRILSRPGTKLDQNYPLKAAPLVLQALEKYLVFNFPISKVDNLAVPEFRWKGMENLALIIYNEAGFLVRKNASVRNEINAVKIIAHEYAHQWFGNLVTPIWWSYLWLSEGIAALMEYIIVDKLHPEWDMAQMFIIDRYQMILEHDSYASRHPLTHWPRNQTDVLELFDKVTYSKGACFFRMLQHSLTEATFRKALSRYLEEQKYKTADEDILFEHFSKAAIEDNRFGDQDIDLVSFLKTWTRQNGYPLVTVVRDYNEGTFRLSQNPFDRTGSNKIGDSRVWWIPYNFATANLPNFEDTTMDGYLEAGVEAKISPALKMWTSSDWLVLNKQQTSFYRVNYDYKNWELIIKGLWNDHTAFHVNNRAQLIDDSYNLVLANILQARYFLDVLKYLEKEEEYAPWETASKILLDLKYRLVDEDNSSVFDYFIRTLISIGYNRFGIAEKPNEKVSQKFTRSVLVNLACRSGLHACIRQSREKLKAVLNNGSVKLDPDMRSTIFCNGMINASNKDFSKVLSLLVKSKEKHERTEFMDFLGCMQDPALIRLYLTTAMKKSIDINYTQDERLYVVKSVFGKSIQALKAAMEFLLENALEFSNMTAKNSNPATLAIDHMAPMIVNKRLKEDFDNILTKFRRLRLITVFEIDLIEKKVKSNLEWANRHQKPFVDWLSTYKKQSAPKEVQSNGNKKKILSLIVLVSTVSLL